MVEFLFNEIAALKSCNFIIKKLQHRCFLVNIAKFLRITFFYRTPLVAISALYRLLFCGILAQANQDKIVYVIFLQNHCCTLRANITQVISLYNVVSDVALTLSIEYTVFLCNASQLDRHNSV